MAADSVMPNIEFERWGSGAAAGDTPNGGNQSAPGVTFERWGEASAAPSVATDIAKSAGIGLVKGGIGLAGLPGDFASRFNRGIDWAESKMGLSPQPASDALTSGALTRGVESVTGGSLYQPKTTAGEYAQTIGEFAPNAVGGGGGLGARLLRLVGPAVASETAGQATAGTALEPVARIGGALAGGGVGALRKPATLAAPSAEALGQAAEAGYSAARNLGVEIKSAPIHNLSLSAESELYKDGFRDYLAPKTYAALAEMRKTPPGSVATIADLDGMRRVLGKAAGDYLNPTEKAAASRVIGKLDDYLENIPAAHVIKGDAAQASKLLGEARGNYAAMKRSETVTNAAERADLNAAVANSGQNIDNATRQRVKAILTNPKALRGFSPAEQLQMHQIARGTLPGNLSRAVGNLLGGGGGLGALVTGGAGVMAAGPAGVLAPAAGYALKKIGNASTARGVSRLDEMVRARSPLAQQAAARQPAVPAPRQLTPRQQRLIAAALGLQTIDPNLVRAR